MEVFHPGVAPSLENYCFFGQRFERGRVLGPYHSMNVTEKPIKRDWVCLLHMQLLDLFVNDLI